MSHARKDYFGDGIHEAASDSEQDRAQKDEQIRKAPYLPRVQVWARDDGPYTLRVGNQWFHCDDLIINGGEYRQKAKPPSARQPATPGNQSVYPPQKSRRPMAGRAQSYQRSRPEKAPNPKSSSESQNSERLSSQIQYQPQSLPTPKEQAEKPRRRHKDADTEIHPERRERRDSGVSVGKDVEAQDGALVTWQPQQSQMESQPLPRPALTRRPSKQARPMRPRPGPSRNSSYDIPVRSKGRKQVRFASVAQ